MTRLLLIFVCWFAVGCEWLGFGAEPPPPEKFTSPSVVEEIRPETAPISEPPRVIANIALKWRAPDEEVDGFVIYYGKSTDTLTNEKRISTADIDRVEGTNGTKVYRYILEGVETAGPLFVSVASYDGDILSPRSAPWEVKIPN